MAMSRTGGDGAAGPPPAPVRRPRPTAPALDYYLVRPRPSDDRPAAPPEGIVVEEFLFGADHTVLRVDSAAWTPGGPGWWTAPALSRNIRADPELRGRVVGVPRHRAEVVYRQLGGATLPDEATLRGHLRAGDTRATSAPLLLSPERVTPGFHSTRVYRVLFANELGPDDLVELSSVWQMAGTDPPRPGGVVGTARRRVGADVFRWELRRIGVVGAYCLDLTVDLATGRDDGVRPVLRELTTTLRLRGLIPVTVERFS
ncbi:hypothetical protein CA850_00235 [Micromonospora echinospora]|uniref:Uncharacterized protein n=1 Tax=Micromonospora echinospora TaxID=1877 RepID=A0A1C4XYX7_MICEC|nr:hypothetical protein [Micromonospora echinospora]OZV84341.1 hypothetical protein CA850_00235 [Micromonospora echinospora]SCF13684.1 hypothetical protein GA0070618_3464 [Micromonospora echinospora]